MTKRLTEGQKKARETIRAAAREVVRQVDEMNCRKNATEFTAWFHLDCVSFDERHKYNGHLIGQNVPVFSGAITRRATR